MQKWQNFEEKINNIIKSIFSKSSKALSDKTPNKVKNSYRKTGDKLKDKFSSNSLALKKAVNSTVNSTQKKAAIIKKRSQDLSKKAKSIDYKEIKRKGILVTLAALVGPLLYKIKVYVTGLKSTTIAGTIGIATFTTLAGLNIYTQSKKISEKAKAKAAQAEQVEKVEKADSLTKRPSYHKKEEKTFLIYDIILPAYFEKNKNISKLVIDLSIESSNKYIKAYFLKNPHYINDVLNSRIEPISVDFPLEAEGKIIIKDKIKRELNILIKKRKIKGQINEINIHKIVGG